MMCRIVCSMALLIAQDFYAANNFPVSLSNLHVDFQALAYALPEPIIPLEELLPKKQPVSPMPVVVFPEVEKFFDLLEEYQEEYGRLLNEIMREEKNSPGYLDAILHVEEYKESGRAQLPYELSHLESRSQAIATDYQRLHTIYQILSGKKIKLAGEAVTQRLTLPMLKAVLGEADLTRLQAEGLKSQGLSIKLLQEYAKKKGIIEQLFEQGFGAGDTPSRMNIKRFVANPKE